MDPRKAALIAWALDAGERVVKSFLVGWLGAWLAFQDRELGQLFAADTLEAGVAAAAGSLLLALGARKIGSRASASLLPALLPELPPELTGTAPNVVAFDGRSLARRRPVTPVNGAPPAPSPRGRRL